MKRKKVTKKRRKSVRKVSRKKLVDPIHLSRDLQMAIMMGPLNQLIARLDIVFIEHFGRRFRN